MQTLERPLRDAERRWLRRMAKSQRAAGRRSARAYIVTGIIGLLVFGLIVGLILVFSSVNWRMVPVFGVLLGFIWLWACIEDRWRFGRSVRGFDRALTRNKAQVTQIQSSAVVEIEEKDDEGPTYAFQVTEKEIVFVSGQEFYPSARFPNTCFSIIELFGDAGAVVGIFIEKRGKKLAPLRKISPTAARKFWRPKHLQVVEGSLNELELLLSNRSRLGSLKSA